MLDKENIMTELHKMLIGKTTNTCDIHLYKQFSMIKEGAKNWLLKLEKNGYEHSKRLEEYLDDLTIKARKNKLLSTGEIFILLCSVYLHDIGYWNNGRLVAEGHPERSKDMVIKEPGKYLLNVIPKIFNEHPLVAQAIGWVCYGHSEETYLPLKKVPNDFSDKALSDKIINLRKITALLRIADEADDPYIRHFGNSSHSLRDNTKLVEIGEETIVWHWGKSGNSYCDFLRHIKQKHAKLESSNDYLRDLRLGYWYLVLYPQFPTKLFHSKITCAVKDRLVDLAKEPEMNETIIDLLIEAVQRQDPTERYWIYVALGQIGGEKAKSAVINAIAGGEKEEWARSGAEEAQKQIMAK